MAVLTSLELTELRQRVQAAGAIDVPKGTLNTACQAIEDWFEANRASLGAAIEAAIPGITTNAQKKRLVKFWLAQKFGRE